MSRTDRHRPHQVQVADQAEQNFYWFDSGGSWGWTKAFHHRTCGCRLCGGYYWRKESNRKRRHEDRRKARKVLKGAEWV